MISKLHS